jgi:hypothetical protein
VTDELGPAAAERPGAGPTIEPVARTWIVAGSPENHTAPPNRCSPLIRSQERGRG